MAITLLQQTYRELIQGAEVLYAPHPQDSFDGTWCYPEELGQGYTRWIELRDGLVITIDNYQPRDQLIIRSFDRTHPIECTFHLSGQIQQDSILVCANQYALYGSGLALSGVSAVQSEQTITWLSIHIAPALFRHWMGNSIEQTTQPIQELLRQPDQPYYTHVRNTTAVMQTVLQQMLHCSYEGIIKRLYLESKVWELMTLVLQHMLVEQPDDRPPFKLKPEDIECIHHAKDILLQNFDNPPTLVELARQAKLNECTLKRGFRQVFGTTAFDYLHHYRLNQSRQLIEQQHMSVANVAHAVGFASRSSFARAFRQKFGVNPGQYLRHHTQRKNSG